MSITYSLANNKITVTGYSEITPADFTDLWTEDKLGTLELMPATTPAMNMTLTTQIKPSDELALKIDFILASSGAGAGDTIDITGLDKDSGVQSETIDVSGGDATYGSSKWFKSITDIDCNGFSSGTLTVRQNQWGVVWKNNNQFIIDSFLEIGISAWFADINKIITFNDGIVTANGQYLILVEAAAHFQLGILDNLDTKKVSNGCFIQSLESSYNIELIRNKRTIDNVCIYDSYIKGEGTKFVAMRISGKVWHSILDNINFQATSRYIIDLFKIEILNIQNSGIMRPDSESIIEDIYIQGTLHAVELGVGESCYLKNIKGQDFSGSTIYLFSPAAPNYLIDCDFDEWTFAGGGGFDWTTYRQYTFNLKIVSQDGNPITTAKVKADYKTGVCFAQEDVDASGNLVTDKTITKGFYNQANGNNLVYQEAGFDYEYIDLKISAVGYVTHKERFSIEGKMSKTGTNIVKLNRIGQPPALESHNV